MAIGIKCFNTLFVLVFFVLTLSSCNSTQTSSNNTNSPGTVDVNLNQIQAHMAFLADDLLEGRDTGSRGHEIASLYIANEFAKYGLKPGGDDDTFMQRVKFRRTRLDQTSPQFKIINHDEVEFSFPNDFIVGASDINTSSFVSAELVFVGYGIVANELDYDDYAGLDVDGKIVVLLRGRPESIASDVGASVASSSQKRENAVSRGAVGMISLQTPIAEEARPYSRFLSFVQAPRLKWLSKNKEPSEAAPQLNASTTLSIEAGLKLFNAAGKDLQSIFNEIENGDVPLGFEMKISTELSYLSTHEEITSPNVIGLLPGSDANLKNEYVVYTAHSDHLGVSKSVEKDAINNGALDNASGTSVLIETARMFASLPNPPKRSILFVAVTGEERGLLGADYFVQHPTVSGDMVANVNLDMPLLTFEFADVIAFGAEHSTMGISVEKAVANANMKLTPDPWPELNLFTRSDHYAFVKQGIPAVFLVAGIESRTDGIDGSTVLQTFLGTHYHRPSDDMSQAFVWPAAINFTRVNFEIGLTLSNQAQRPAWYEDSYFGQRFSDNLVPRQQ